MGLIRRYLTEKITADLSKKMVFLGGPRQVGKTTCAQRILTENQQAAGILNWDDDEDREAILSKQFPINEGILVFDELHKYHRWRNYLKGLFDKRKNTLKILVTGSARLDLYRFGGDSLQGRYFYHRLHPLSVSELGIKTQSELENLLLLSGFPEPFFSQSEVEKKRWTIAYRSRLIREDLRDLERVNEITTIDLLSRRLPALVGSPLSLNSIREDLQVSHATIEKWLNILERLYFIFRIHPFGPPKVRAVKKARKHYHFDWSLLEELGPRFENFIASHLLKWCHYQEDSFGREIELRYYRDSENREVDFVLLEKGKPLLFIEVKTASTEISRGLCYLKGRYPDTRSVQVCLECKNRPFSVEGIERLSALEFLQELV